MKYSLKSVALQQCENLESPGEAKAWFSVSPTQNLKTSGHFI